MPRRKQIWQIDILQGLSKEKKKTPKRKGFLTDSSWTKKVQIENLLAYETKMDKGGGGSAPNSKSSNKGRLWKGINAPKKLENSSTSNGAHRENVFESSQVSSVWLGKDSVAGGQMGVGDGIGG